MTLPGSLPVGPVRSLEDLNRRARALPTRIVVIAAAQDEVALEAAAVAEEVGLGRCILVGDQHRIEGVLWDMDRDPREFQIVNRQELHESVTTAVELVKAGEGHILMKGKVTTGDLLREVLVVSRHHHRHIETTSDGLLVASPQRRTHTSHASHGVHPCARFARDLSRSVRRTVVHDQNLVHERPRRATNHPPNLQFLVEDGRDGNDPQSAIHSRMVSAKGDYAPSVR